MRRRRRAHSHVVVVVRQPPLLVVEGHKGEVAPCFVALAHSAHRCPRWNARPFSRPRWRRRALPALVRQAAVEALEPPALFNLLGAERCNGRRLACFKKGSVAPTPASTAAHPTPCATRRRASSSRRRAASTEWLSSRLAEPDARRCGARKAQGEEASGVDLAGVSLTVISLADLKAPQDLDLTQPKSWSQHLGDLEAFHLPRDPGQGPSLCPARS